MSHAKLSPSSSDRWMTCPASIRLSEGMPNKSSAFAEEGTRAHALAEQILCGEFIDPSDIEDGMLDNVLIYVDHIKDLVDTTEGDLMIEVRVHVNEDIYGTADAIVWSENSKTLYVRDLKYGAGLAVEVLDNTQLKIYALAALLTTGKKADVIDLGIVQPRCPHADGPIRTLQYDAIELIDFWSDILEAAEKTKLIDSPIVAGEHCRFCPAAPVCPEIKSKAQLAARNVFSVGNVYDPKELSKMLDWLPVLEGWIKNVREFAYQEAEAGNTPPNYKLVEKRATRRWRVEETAQAELVKVLGDEIFDKKFKSPAQIEKLLDKTQKGLVTELTMKESSGHTLVHEDDSRQAVRVDAKAAFLNIDME